MNQPTKILKRSARMALMGRYLPSTCAFFLSALISLLLAWLLNISGFSPLGDPMRRLSFWALAAVILLLNAVLSIGLTRFFFQMTLGKPISFRDLFYGFTNNPDRFIIAAALRYGLLAIGWIPAVSYYLHMPVFTECTPGQLLLLPTLVLLAVVLNLPVLLIYGQSFYILLEQPDCSPLASMGLSRQLMAGHKKRLFSLYVSFLGYELLSLGTMGMGDLWLRPYMEMIQIQFYLDVSGREVRRETPPCTNPENGNTAAEE